MTSTSATTPYRRPYHPSYLENTKGGVNFFGKRQITRPNPRGAVDLKKISNQFLATLAAFTTIDRAKLDGFDEYVNDTLNRYSLSDTKKHLNFILCQYTEDQEKTHQIKAHIERLYQESDQAIAKANWFTKILALIRDFFDHTRKEIHNLFSPTSPNTKYDNSEYVETLRKKLNELSQRDELTG